MRQFILLMLSILIFLGCERSSGHSTSDGTTNETPVIVEAPAKNWYVYLVATDIARGLETRSASLGELDKADATVEQKTDRAIPFSDTYIDIAFIDPEGLDEGEYKSHFLPYREGEQMWRFTVLSDDANALVALTWRGMFKLTPYGDEDGKIRYSESLNRSNPILNMMQLIDEKTGETVAVAKGSRPRTISFNMDGETSRTFRWERKVEDIKIEELGDAKDSAAVRSASRSIGYSNDILSNSEESSTNVADFGTIVPKSFSVPNHNKTEKKYAEV